MEMTGGNENFAERQRNKGLEMSVGTTIFISLDPVLVKILFVCAILVYLNMGKSGTETETRPWVSPREATAPTHCFPCVLMATRFSESSVAVWMFCTSLETSFWHCFLSSSFPAHTHKRQKGKGDEPNDSETGVCTIINYLVGVDPNFFKSPSEEMIL